MTSTGAHPHHEWISHTLPSWYVNATAHARQTLNRDMIKGHKQREQLGKTLADIKPLDEFARPLLIKALEDEFGPGLDVDNTYCFKHIYKRDAAGELKLAPPELCLQSLLHAALQNFHQEEVAQPDATGKMQIVQIKRVSDPRYGTYDQYPLHPMNVDPARFMTVCRQLDLGGLYQAHLDAVVGASGGGSQARANANSAAIAELIGDKEHNALLVQAHLAHLQKDISDAFYNQVLGLAARAKSAGLEYRCLKICGFSVRDILIFRIKGEKACVIYVPGEPLNGMKEFSSFDELKTLLSRRFTPAFCKVFMGRFIAERSKAAFFHKVAERIAPAHVRFDPEDSAIIPRLIHVREVAADFDLDIELDEIPYDLSTHFHFQKMLRIKDDARALAVPTGDEDEESRRARLAGYLALGMNAVNLAALFVPVLGEAMMVVVGAQLLAETFQGIDAWSHGDMEQALDHLGSVAENLAFMAAFGGLLKAGAAPEIPAIKGSSFVGKMVPITLPGGETRLWSPDLAPFAHDIVPPQGAQLTGEGLLTHQGKHYLPLDGRFYPVRHDAVLNKWRIEPPRGERFSPLLEHNGAGGWRHEGENPLAWDARTSFKRLSPEAAALPDALIDTVMEVTATRHAGLLELHLDNQPPPAGLTDAIQRFAVDEHVRTFCQQISDVAGFASADPHLQMELLTSMPRWPVGRPIQVIDAQGLKIAEYGSDLVLPGRPDGTLEIRPLTVTQAQIDEGKLLPTVIHGLGEAGQNRMFGRSVPRTPEQLAADMASVARERSSSLFDRLYRIRDASSDPRINLIKRDFPTLSTAAARELLTQATAEQLASMAATGRLPLEVAGRARGYAQEGRLYRVLEGFCLATRADNADTLKVSMALLGDVPGWPADLRLEVREGSSQGPLVESLGQPEASQRRVLIKRGQTYHAADAQGHDLSPIPGPQDNFFSAVLHALPESTRHAIGFPDVIADAAVLRSRIISAALKDRPRVSKILQQWALKPRVHWPRRLADGRIGYELSGNGALNPLFPFMEELDHAERDLMRVLRALYPEVPDLQAYVTGRLITNGYNAQLLLDFARAEQRAFEPLRCALEGWVHTADVGGGGQSAARRAIAEAISAGWRSSRPHSPLRYRPMVLESLDLAGLSELPNMPGHFRDITRITLRNVTASDEQMGHFLRRFSGMTRLEIVGGGMTRVPDGLAGLTQLEELSFEGMGLTIDQAAMEQFMNMPRLSMLDLSGNTLGAVTDASRLPVSRLYLANMQLTQWPEWTNTLGLSVLDVSNNQIEHLPLHLIRNERGAYFQTTVYGNANPFNHDELQECWLNQRNGNIYELEYDYPDSIRELARTPSSSEAESEYYSSDDDSDWHSHDFDPSPPAAPVPSVDIWIVEGRTDLNSRIRSAWERVEQVNDAPNLLILLQRLRETRDFTRVHEELAGDVMRVLEAAAHDTQLRGELEVMANDRLFGPDQTCQDGARLIFSDIQVAVYARAALQGVPEAQQTEALFGVMRSLFRLNEVQTIADLEIADREARGLHVDHAEVRLAYRIGLANQLNLPAQPLNMVWDRLAAVEHRAILDARRLILQRETGPEFLEYALADRRWSERLRVEYRTDLERITAPIRAEQEALLEHPPVDTTENLHRLSAIYERLDAAHAANDPAALAAANRDLQELTANPPIDNDEFDRQGRALIARLAAAEEAFLAQMTNSLRQNW